VRYARPRGGHVEISGQAQDALFQMRQVDDDAPEGGGVLLGRLIVDSDDVVIDEITTPGPHDRRARYWFNRSKKSAQPRVNEAWAQSGGTRIYLGDWHSHPEDHPTPSRVDRKDWARVLKEASYEQASLFFVIVGRRSTSLWEGRVTTGGKTELEECRVDL